MQIVLFIIFILIVLLIVFSKQTSFSKNAQKAILITVAIGVVSIYLYESGIDKKAQKNREIVNAFEQGKILTCNELKVDSTKYLYISGTQTFMPKKSESELKGIVLKVSTCKAD